ncbi:unnamed protein product (macronuclear) [Paramecium tetraurelia]|uniref:Uncharacterized protein n=1 Tax=Paramecium tetraurelia TaxID=5888 RepID=A0CNW4_PARTE|nr:uncharacterized protein GSPATT00038750001 [Paramecium tetraurelia]CAK72481.1 unnamed protein product [Paramecium tetraurelia]|eukprot:XP_001439878.1 hypothetical protein (macronuclear) [Paramecium tetraurelia strain d4-2]
MIQINTIPDIKATQASSQALLDTYLSFYRLCYNKVLQVLNEIIQVVKADWTTSKHKRMKDIRQKVIHLWIPS